jgi:hypothetical protein
LEAVRRSAAVISESRRLFAGTAVLCCFWSAAAFSQSDADNRAQTKSFQVVRDDAVPAIDGVLDEDVWSRAALVEDLHQMNPVEYAEPSEPTEIRVFYGDDALYIAARLYDSEPGQITANVLRQGEGLGSEDRFAVILDPYLDQRSGYRFQVNPNGVRWEALYKNTSDVESNWSGIWQAAATRDDGGWTAEMRIPFKTLSFNPNNSEWGINFERTIQRNDEKLGWVSRNRQLNPGIAGTVTGFHDLQQGIGLDIAASASVVDKRVYGAAPGDRNDLVPSLDVFYKITPSLNGALTVNTDFSATEVDERQVNLTRFSLFFPEKRDFFLQDADIFEFGRIGGGRFNNGNGNPAISAAAAQNARPFFSRQIGLSSTGDPVDIDYGGKVSGRVGRWNIGTLAIRQAAYEDVNATNVFVGRVAANVLEESAVGMIVTDGDPQSNLDSSLIGADFDYRNSRLPGGRLIEGQAWYQQTDTEGLHGDNRAFGLGISSPNNTGWRGGFNTRQVEQNFDPAVGFVSNAGIRDYALDFGYRYRFREHYLQSIYGGFDSYRSVRLDTGRVQSEQLGLRVSAQNNVQDGFFTRLVTNREVLSEDFEIYAASDGSERVVIPAGDYRFNELMMGADTGKQRRISGRFTMRHGDFYDGTHTNANAEVRWRPSEHFRFGLKYEVNDIDLPDGAFVVRLSQVRADIAFSSTLSWTNLLQYDNVTESVGFNSRLHWIPQAGREGFIVLNHALSDADRDGTFRSTNADASVKFNYTWRF